MNEDWIELPFEEAIDFREGPGILAKDFRDSGVPLIRLSGLDRGRSVLYGCNFLDPKTVEKRWSHFAVGKGDLLLSTSASLGRIAIVDDEGVGAIPYTGIIRMRPQDERLYAPFIRYLLEGLHFQEQVEIAGVGSVIRHFGPMHLRQMTVQLPPLEDQYNITEILGSLDDKIEANRRQNETLEATARAIFKSWFVDFDPVHAKARGENPPGMDAATAALFPAEFEESELGLIPRGWTWEKLGDVCEYVISGGTPNTRIDDYWGGSIPWLSSGETRNSYIIDTEKTITQRGIDESSTRFAPSLSTVIASAGQGHTRGQTSILMIDTYINQSVIALGAISPPISPMYLFFNLSRRYDELRQISDSSSSRGSLTTALLKGLDICIPSNDLVYTFDSLASSIVNQIAHNRLESRTLAETRDALLPRLVSGELRVGDL